MDQTFLTEQNIDDLVVTASYDGITYWATVASQEQKEDAFASNPDALMVFLDDNGEVIVVTKESVRTAYFALLDLDQQHVNREIHGYFINSWRDRTREAGVDMGEIDATAADVWVQLAAFGEVVYG